MFHFFLLMMTIAQTTQAADTLFVRETRIPILIERQDNILYYLRLDARESNKLDDLTLKFGDEVNPADIQSVKLYYSGTEARQDADKKRFAPVSYLTSHTPHQTRTANPSYSVMKDKADNPGSLVVLKSDQKLFPGVNFFWISLQMKPGASLLTKVTSEIASATIDGKKIQPQVVSPKGIEHRMGVGVRHAGDDHSAAFRIPGLVTTNNGTLLGVYDIRYNNSVDLQEMVDVGISRSTDHGNTWQPMRTAMTFGQTGGLPHAQNGVGDPSILVDETTNTIWVIAAWTHGMGNQRAWWSSFPGTDANHTAQLMLTKSQDDGKTWSEPINITSQVKDPSW